MTNLTLPSTAVPIALADGRANPAWYEKLQRMADAGNSVTAADVAALEARIAELEANEQTVIAEGTLSGSEVDITDIPQTFAQLLLNITGMSFDTDAANPQLQVSSDNGVSFDDTAGNYSHFAITGVLATASLLVPVTHTLAADTSDHIVEIIGYRENSYTKAEGFVRIGASFLLAWATHWSLDAVNALRIKAQGGAFDAGDYKLIGVR